MQTAVTWFTLQLPELDTVWVDNFQGVNFHAIQYSVLFEISRVVNFVELGCGTISHTPSKGF